MKIFCRNDLLLLPIVNAGKKYIKEITWLLNPWSQDAPLRSISLKAIFTIPALLMQKLSKTSKSKDKTAVMEKRWNNSLLLEAETLQQKLTSNNNPQILLTYIRSSRNWWEKGNINETLKLLTNNMTNCSILALDEKTTQFFKIEISSITSSLRRNTYQ